MHMVFVVTRQHMMVLTVQKLEVPGCDIRHIQVPGRLPVWASRGQNVVVAWGHTLSEQWLDSSLSHSYATEKCLHCRLLLEFQSLQYSLPHLHQMVEGKDFSVVNIRATQFHRGLLCYHAFVQLSLTLSHFIRTFHIDIIIGSLQILIEIRLKGTRSSSCNTVQGLHIWDTWDTRA